jgi:hypothetical protein
MTEPIPKSELVLIRGQVTAFTKKRNRSPQQYGIQGAGEHCVAVYVRNVVQRKCIANKFNGPKKL